MRDPPCDVTVLVAAASKHGATREIAQAIGRALEEQGVDVHVEAIDSLERVEGYDAFALGSAVYMGHWLEPARTFVDRHAQELRARPTWLFSSGPIGDPPRPRDDDAVKANDLVATARAKGHRLFAGRIDKSQLGLAERAVMHAVGGRDGDYRDWDAITAWARQIASELR
jgi:menaquinone-dependent protoporphyrinogen oxidase